MIHSTLVMFLRGSPFLNWLRLGSSRASNAMASMALLAAVPTIGPTPGLAPACCREPGALRLPCQPVAPGFKELTPVWP